MKRYWGRLRGRQYASTLGKHVQKVLIGVVTGALIALSGVVMISPAAAANGANLRTIIADRHGGPCGSVDAQGDHNGVGTGVAFDGTHLLLSCWYDGNIVAVSPANGSYVATHTITGRTNFEALAWDNGRTALWACTDHGSVGTISLSANTFSPKFTVTGCTDGLAYDAADDTIWASADAAYSVEHYSISGTLIHSYPVDLGGCGNSGIAVGGPKLYLANNGCSQIYTVDKGFTTTPALFASFPRRIEDLECDNVTFAAQAKGAIWSNDAYDNILNAWEIPAGSCSFGGGGVDTTAPSCKLTDTFAGPPKGIHVTAKDGLATDTGLKSIVVTKNVNANVVVPPFTQGTKNAVVVTATRVDNNVSAQIALRVTDVAGNVTNCDPVLTTLVKENKPQAFTDVPDAEHLVTVINDSPGLRLIAVTVNGTAYRRNLQPGQEVTIDVIKSIKAGANTFGLRGFGPGSAEIIIWDGNGTI
jgi:hypothetical protein